MEYKQLLSLLLDERSYAPLSEYAGFGAVGERPAVCAAGRDAALCGALDFALKTGAPVILLLDGGDIAQPYPACRALARMSGAVPLFAIVDENISRSAQTLAALCDFRVYARAEGARGGCCDILARDDAAAAEHIRALMDFLPSNCAEDAPLLDARADLARCALPVRESAPEEVFSGLADTGTLYPLQDGSAYFARVGGRAVCMLAAPQGAPRLIRLCDCYSLPLVGLITGARADIDAKCVYAWAEASVPKIGLGVPGAGWDGRAFDLTLPVNDMCRASLIRALDMLAAKRDTPPPRKHGNMPL